MKRGLLLSSLLAVLISACMPFGMGRSAYSRFDTAYQNNGERIYFTATNERGERIRTRGGPAFGGMITGRLTCASCHGADGRGGTRWIHMQTIEAPDIRWEVLSSGEHGDHGEHQGESGEGAAYDAEAFGRAVREGLAPGGHRLSADMPRWEIGDEDLQDLIDFLATLH